MDLHHLRAFLHLADKLHFWQTAEQLHMTQSSLSRQMQRLEAELGFRLFERTQRVVRLTAAGKFFQQEWQRLLPEVEAVQRQAQQVSTGQVGSLRIGHIGAVAYGWLPRLLTAFTPRYPLLHIELSEVMATEFEQRLLTYQLDIGIRREPTQHPTLASQHAFSEPLVLVVPTDHPLDAHTFTSLASLRDERFVLPRLDGSSPYVQHLQALFAQYGYQPRMHLTSEFGATLLNLVVAGLGLSVLPKSYITTPLTGLRFLELPHQSPVFVVWRKDDTSAVVQQLLATVQQLTSPS
ncbi:MAG: LysR family transcriptional regulator [Janthinobacterium lividum]